MEVWCISFLGEFFFPLGYFHLHTLPFFKTATTSPGLRLHLSGFSNFSWVLKMQNEKSLFPKSTNY